MKKRLTRLLAICVCLIVVLSACASAPSGESTVSVTTEDSKETSALELSEVNAESTSSETEPLDESSESESSTPEGHISADSEASIPGDITITPVEPTYPEERETTLEKLATFEMGENGLVEYGFLYAEDPSDPTIIPLAHYFADDEGNVYAYRGGIITCLNTGAVMEVAYCNCAQLLLCGDTLYIRDHDATIYRYAPFGKEDMALVETYLNEELERAMVKMIDVGEEEPILEIDRERFCTLENAPVTDADTTFIRKNIDGEYTVLRTKEQPYEIYNKYGKKPSISACSDQGIAIGIYQNSRNCPGRLECFEYLYAQYDDKGNILSQFMLEFSYSGRVPCEMPYPAGVLTSYNGMTATIGKNLFEGTLGQEVIEGENGTYYLVVCYPDYGEVYKINPGYSSKGLTDPALNEE